MSELLELKEEIWCLDNELLSLARRLLKLMGEIAGIEAKVRWIVQKKYEPNHRVYKFMKERGSVVVKTMPDPTLIKLQEKPSELLYWVNQLRIGLEGLDCLFSESLSGVKA